MVAQAEQWPIFSRGALWALMIRHMSWARFQELQLFVDRLEPKCLSALQDELFVLLHIGAMLHQPEPGEELFTLAQHSCDLPMALRIYEVCPCARSERLVDLCAHGSAVEELEQIWTVGGSKRVERLLALLSRPKDPRIARGLLKRIPHGALLKQEGVAFLGVVLKHGHCRMDVLQDSEHRAAANTNLALALEGLEPASEEANVAIEWAIKNRQRSAGASAQRSIEILFEEVYEAQDDDALKRVLAEALKAKGDPRGEFIDLQLRAAQGQLSQEEHALMDALEQRYAKRWLGPLARLIERSSARFHKGFLSACTVNQLDDQLIHHRAWRTVQVLNFAKAELSQMLVLNRLPKLRVAGGVELSVLCELAGRGPVEIGVAPLKEAPLEAFADAVRASTNLRRLRLPRDTHQRDWETFVHAIRDISLHQLDVHEWQIQSWRARLYDFGYFPKVLQLHDNDEGRFENSVRILDLHGAPPGRQDRFETLRGELKAFLSWAKGSVCFEDSLQPVLVNRIEIWSPEGLEPNDLHMIRPVLESFSRWRKLDIEKRGALYTIRAFHRPEGFGPHSA